MTTIATEIVTQHFGGIEPQKILRTKPHAAGGDLFTDEQGGVWVTLSQSAPGEDSPLRPVPAYISVAPNLDDPDFTLDYSEEDAVNLLGALAFAIGDLRSVRKGQA